MQGFDSILRIFALGVTPSKEDLLVCVCMCVYIHWVLGALNLGGNVAGALS
jgi:hypothetical protein